MKRDPETDDDDLCRLVLWICVAIVAAALGASLVLRFVILPVTGHG